MENKKMTYREALEIAKACIANAIALGDGSEADLAKMEEAKGKLVLLQASLVKKNSTKSATPTAKQKENAELIQQIREWFEANPTKVAVVAELIKSVPALNECSPQKVTPLVGKLVEGGILKKEKQKNGRIAYTLVRE